MANRQREPEAIWLHWTTNLETSVVSCLYCQKSQQKHASRCKGHTARCTSAPMNVRNLFKMNLPMSVAARKKGLHPPPNANTQLQSISSEAENSAVETNVPAISFGELDDLVNMDVDDQGSAVISADHAAAASLSSVSTLQTTLTGSINRLSSQKLKDLQVLFVKAMISGSVPFNFLTDPYLQEFFAALGSGFSLPARLQASGTILDILELQASEKIKDILTKERHFSIVPDGLSNIKGVSVINIMLANPNVCVFVRSIETGEEHQTASYIKTQLNQVINEMCKNYGNENICAIVSDQGANYLKARNEMALENNQIISVNCAAHLLNLLAGDFCKFPSVQLIVNQAKSIVKEIKNSKVKLGAYNAEFKRYIAEQHEKGINGITEVSLALPCVTRWLGIRLMIEKLNRARPVLERMALAGNNSLEAKIKGIIKTDHFWEKLGNINLIILELTDGILKVESQAACISDVVEEFLKLKEVFTEDGKKYNLILNAVNNCEIRKSKDIFLRRFTDKSITLNHYVANLLDPRYRGERFKNDAEKLMKVLTALESYARKVNVAVCDEETMCLGTQLTNFRMRTGYFETNMLNHPVPHLFWENYMQFPDTKVLASIGCRLLSIPASSAGVERSFSVQAHMHNKSRNRLSEVKVDKMMRIKWILNHEAKNSKKAGTSRFPSKVFNIHGNSLENYRENEDCDVDEIIVLDKAFLEPELFEVAANSSPEAANPT